MQNHRVLFARLLLISGLIVAILFVIWGTNSRTLPVSASVLSSDVILNQNVSGTSDTTVAAPTNCRYGVSSFSNDDFNFLQDLGVGWTLNFGVGFNNALPDGIEYTPMIRFKPVLDGNGDRTDDYKVTTQPFTDVSGGLGPVIAAHPGKLWLVGNEVDRTVWQDDLMPDVYAKAYHDAYHFIKERDPSAQVAISGLVEVTPGRLQYLDLVWNSYLKNYGTPMPVDVWNMHIYILPEKRPNGDDAGAAVALGTDPAIAIWESGNNAALCANDDVYCHAEHDSLTIFAKQVVAMRQWMKNHGQQNKPLILSEFSLLHPYDQEGDTDPNTCYVQDEYGKCFTPERVSKYMSDTFTYLEVAADPALGFPADNNRLVQQWLWFTVAYYDTFSSNLLEPDYTLTSYQLRLPGQTFKNQVNGKRPFLSQPFVSQVSYPTGTTITATGTTSVTIAATIYNRGNTQTTVPIEVRFFADQAKTDLIGTAVIPTGLNGCAIWPAQTDVVWNDLSAGVHPYWAEAVGGNTVKGFVIINPEEVFLPAILR